MSRRQTDVGDTGHERNLRKQQRQLRLPAKEHAWKAHPRSDVKRSSRGERLAFVAGGTLETVARRLREAGFPPDGDVVDQEWGRSLFVRAPDGTVVQVDEQDPELYR